MSGVKTRLEQTTDDTKGVESLRLEMERCQRELEACRLRLGELEQGEALLAGENRLLEMVAKGEALPSILDGICRLVEEISTGSLCSILLLDANGERLWHGAAPSLPASYTSAFDGRAIGPETGPCGRATYFRKPVIVCDIAADPLGDDYRELALAHGLQACWSTPIFSTTRAVMGTFALYSREPVGPSSEQLNLIEQITHLAAVAIEREQAAEALHASEHLARGQVEALKSALDAVATESAPDRLVEHVLRTLTEQFGAHSSSVWRRDEAKGMIGFEFAFEDGRIVTKADSRFAGMDLWLPMEDFWPWPEVFRTGKPSVIEDIRTVRPFPLRDRLLALGIVTVLLIPMSVVGRLEGAIGLRFTQKRGFRTEEIELAQALANQAMLAMQLTRLSAESRESAVIAERNRMARDIHDTLAQGFTGVIMQLEATKGAIAQNNLAEATDRVGRAGDLARVGLGEARRSVLALRPRSLQDTTLCLALDDLLKRMTNGSGLQAEFHLEGDESTMPADWEEGLLRIAQESLTNTIKHAKAKTFRATLAIAPNEIQFRLVDDGVGFDLHAEHEGFGLVGMKERVDQIGGQFILRSMPGQGAEIQIVLNR